MSGWCQGLGQGIGLLLYNVGGRGYSTSLGEAAGAAENDQQAQVSGGCSGLNGGGRGV